MTVIGDGILIVADCDDTDPVLVIKPDGDCDGVLTACDCDGWQCQSW